MMEKFLNEFKSIKEDLVHISEELYHHPELGNKEFKSKQLLVNYLEKNDFNIEEGLINIPTSFRATYTSDAPGPTIAYLAEYDALPGIGHGCGHNLIAATSVGAGIVLSKFIYKSGGKVVILGTPSYESVVVKVLMADT